MGDTYRRSYFDVDTGAICTRTAPRPDALWSIPVPQITALTVPDLYGGHLHPGGASAASLTLLVSQWNGTLGQPYRVLQFDGVNP
ncbi:DUF4185 domain-containing protein [Streptomyces sp. NPDC055025]